MLIASETFLALCSLAIFSLSSAKTSISSSLQIKKARFDWRGLLYLFRQREMLLIIFFLLCSGIAMNTRRVLMPYIIARGGGTIADQGLACGLAAFLEVPAMLLLVRLRNDRSKEILAIVCILELAAYLLLTLLGSTTIFVVTYCITGFCYGLKMATARKAIYQIAPPSLHTSGQACADITYNSVFRSCRQFSGRLGLPIRWG